MSFEIKKPEAPKKTFILNRALHLDKNNKVVEEDNPAGVRVLGGEGKAFYEEEAKQYGLNDSHRQVEEKPEGGKTGLVIEPEPPKEQPEPVKEPEAPTPPAEPEVKKTAAERRAEKKAEHTEEA